jgi:hypothetical protein
LKDQRPLNVAAKSRRTRDFGGTLTLLFPKLENLDMDIYCRHCGEPWDLMELHDMAGPDGDYENLLPFDDARKLFYKHGCGAFQLHPPQDCAHAPIANADTLAGIDMLQHALGDDIDGLASTLEDFRYAGMMDL